MDQFVFSTSGQFLIYYEWEEDTNWFHSGTNFNDAATGAIWGKNQVSLDAGKTVIGKTHVKAYLWDKACAEINHSQQQWWFSADVFSEDCSEKHQIQGFSGVGAYHQISHAEHAIQIIMYLAKNFMLHWSDYC